MIIQSDTEAEVHHGTVIFTKIKTHNKTNIAFHLENVTLVKETLQFKNILHQNTIITEEFLVIAVHLKDLPIDHDIDVIAVLDSDQVLSPDVVASKNIILFL